VITIRSTGKDWFYVKSFALSDYAPALAALGRIAPDFAALWVYHRRGIDQAGVTPVDDGRVRLTGLRPGTYRATWWDTTLGRPIKEEMLQAPGGPFVLSIPPTSADVAAYLTRQ
jgi:hypothetical protein